MRWSTEEDEIVREMYETHTRAQIADRLGRTEGMVRSRCWTLGLNTKAAEHWSDAEIVSLKAAYSNRTGPVRLAKLSKMLGRSKPNIARKAREIGLTNTHRCKNGQPSLKLPMFASDEDRSKKQSARSKRWHAEHEHPRGALGMKHTDETRAILSDKSRRAWNDPAFPLNDSAHRQRMSDAIHALQMQGKMRKGYSRGRMGKREDLGGLYVRSSWEANYARHLNWLLASGCVLRWEYEAKMFEFPSARRGVRAYTPDFKVTLPDGSVEWHEVKGWMDDASVERLAKMAEFYPDERVIVIGKDWFRLARRSGLADATPGWEHENNRRPREYGVGIRIEPLPSGNPCA